MKLEVPTTVFKEIIDHIEEVFPNEACGLLFGTIQESANRYISHEVLKFENISEHPEVSFVIDPEKLYKALSIYEEKEMQMVAIYHSHQAPPSLSRSDLHYMDSWKGVVWLVFSTISHGPKFPYVGFIMKKDSLFPVQIQIF
ncbi:MAG: Mov34/MPN/PAD-1 family protein [Candidatus Heimdallarchaeota archaeon]